LESLVFRFTKIYEQKTPQRLNESLKGILVWATARENLTLFSLCFRIAWTQSLWRFPLV
jgi:hypothetical protein